MNNYQNITLSRSRDYLLAGIMASGFSASAYAEANAAQAVAQPVRSYFSSNNSSFSIAATAAGSDDRQYQVQSNAKFEDEIRGFYLKLLRSQEPLGLEAAKVLHDNLWDLYAR